MPEVPLRLLMISDHVVQYASSVYRAAARHPNVELCVAYCSLKGAESALDKEFGVRVQWDVPLLDGYCWVQVPSRSTSIPFARGRFLSRINPGLWPLIRLGRFDAVVNYTGYTCVNFWIATAAAISSRAVLLFGIDGASLASISGSRVRRMVKSFLWPRLFRLADVVIVASTGGVRLMQSLGIPSERIALTPMSVDNDWWLSAARQADSLLWRGRLGIPDNALVVLFCAKLQSWKRPGDVLTAFARADIANSYLVFAGDGPLGPHLETMVHQAGLGDRVRFLGFVNQSALPEIYRGCDVLVLPSEYETFGVVVNEAMLCGTPVIVSDQVGARFDLVKHGNTGFVYPVGDVDELARLLRLLDADRAMIRRMGDSARRRMESWSPRENVEALVAAIHRAVERKGVGPKR